MKAYRESRGVVNIPMLYSRGWYIIKRRQNKKTREKKVTNGRLNFSNLTLMYTEKEHSLIFMNT